MYLLNHVLERCKETGEHGGTRQICDDTPKHCRRPCTPIHGNGSRIMHPGTKQKIIQEWFEEHNDFEVWTQDLNPSERAGQTSQFHGGPTSQLTALQVSAVKCMVPDTTAHFSLDKSGLFLQQ